MKNLLLKEFKLAMHPTVVIFFALSAMLLIPNYPYYVVFFYTALGLFFVCLTGRENNDIDYTLLLPVRKRDAVRARILFAATVECIQFVCCALVALLRGSLGLGANAVGMDVNIALFGFSFIMLGLFNRMFFTRYYRAPEKVGKAFVVSSIMVFVFISVAEASAHILPFVKNRLDTPDPMFLPEKLATLALGILIYAALTLGACRQAEKSFELLDL